MSSEYLPLKNEDIHMYITTFLWQGLDNTYIKSEQLYNFRLLNDTYSI